MLESETSGFKKLLGNNCKKAMQDLQQLALGQANKLYVRIPSNQAKYRPSHSRKTDHK